MKSSLSSSLKLPCGQILKNRLVKSAMSENMALAGNRPGPEFYQLYHQWAKGGVGLCISGNVMVDSRYLGEANNVVIERGHEHHDDLRRWATAGKEHDMKLWLQLNHPGKQTPRFICKQPVAPSAIALKPPLDKMFIKPRELTEEEILDIISRFAYASKTAKECGFDGAQIHGAHGYLVSQFLSPHHNQRTDKWGGSLENRMRFPIEIYKAMRDAAGEKFAIGIKINSADFQRGGFSHEDSVLVAAKLSSLGIDLIELSGGSYENPIMMGEAAKKSTQEREAYFMKYAADIKNKIKCPLVLTGGFRTRLGMEQAIENREIDLVGLARSLAIEPDFPNRIFSDINSKSLVKPLTSGLKFLDKLIPLEIVWYTEQLHRIGKGKSARPQASVYPSIVNTVLDVGVQGIKRVRAK